MHGNIWIWVGFIVFVLVLLALDLGVFHRKAHVVGVKEALGWSAVWITLALLFSVFVYFAYENHWLGLGTLPDGPVAIDPVDDVPLDGHAAAVKYLTGYVIEKIAQRRQHLRHRDDLRVLRRAGDLPAPRAVLGHPRRAGHARRR